MLKLLAQAWAHRVLGGAESFLLDALPCDVLVQRLGHDHHREVTGRWCDGHGGFKPRELNVDVTKLQAVPLVPQERIREHIVKQMVVFFVSQINEEIAEVVSVGVSIRSPFVFRLAVRKVFCRALTLVFVTVGQHANHAMEEALAQQLSEELSKQHSVLDEAQVAGLAGWSGRLEVFQKDATQK